MKRSFNVHRLSKPRPPLLREEGHHKHCNLSVEEWVDIRALSVLGFPTYVGESCMHSDSTAESTAIFGVKAKADSSALFISLSVQGSASEGRLRRPATKLRDQCEGKTPSSFQYVALNYLMTFKTVYPSSRAQSSQGYKERHCTFFFGAATHQEKRALGLDSQSCPRFCTA